MNLGAFSVSLSVKDLEASRAFYNTLGFMDFAGDAEHGYVILKNGEHIVGLFHGMFEGNMLTFNPGWDQNAQETEAFTDIREIQAKLKEKGIALATEADPDSSGPASVVLTDPDGNTILIDQHR